MTRFKPYRQQLVTIENPDIAANCDILFNSVRRAGGTGRRAGLKIRWPQGRVGSIPMPGTNLLIHLKEA